MRILETVTSTVRDAVRRHFRARRLEREHRRLLAEAEELRTIATMLSDYRRAQARLRPVFESWEAEALRQYEAGGPGIYFPFGATKPEDF
jgi:hypothetical protein